MHSVTKIFGLAEKAFRSHDLASPGEKVFGKKVLKRFSPVEGGGNGNNSL